MSRYGWSILLIASTGVFSALVMMPVHESGHVLHAWISGGRVERVVVRPLAISRTDVNPNPRPHFVAWGGAVWGCAIPLAAWIAARLARLRAAYLFRFFAGFCLLANGAYLGAAVVSPVGDAADLMRFGTPVWLLGVVGFVAVAAGLWMWHGLGRQFAPAREGNRLQRRDALGMTAAAVLLAAVQFAFG